MTEELAIIDRCVTKYNPSHTFALFSGGHDSLCATHLASQHPAFSGVVHINTGIGIEETRQFVRDTCEEHGWALREYHPTDKYEDLCVKYGFPGPGGHRYMYIKLKERCLRLLLRDTRDPKDRRRKIAFICGTRRAESTRRKMGLAGEMETDRPDPSPRAIWVSPIINWESEDKRIYMEENNLRANLVTDTLCMSGECLCGAFAKPNELEEIRRFYPDAAKEIDRIAALVKDAGQHHTWGTRPGKRVHPDQGDLPLCWSCEAKAEQTTKQEDEKCQQS